MTIIAFETSCDETSVAIIREGVILSNVVSSQIELHSEYGGVVPELATREHLRNLMPITQTALIEANVKPTDMDVVAATQGPGLPSALRVGFQAAQAFAFAIRKPMLGIHHHEAHLYSPWISSNPPHARFDSFEPSLSLIVSGGHTLLVHVRSLLNHQVLGSTIDDAAGECFDKVAKLIGLRYPGGPQIDQLSKQGNATSFHFPRPLLNDSSDDFSFSGLKTSVKYFLRDNPKLLEDRSSVCNLCASVQAAIIEVLVSKTIRAAKRCRVNTVTVSGGVSCNRFLREQIQSECSRNSLQLKLADPKYCTDNAAMIAALAELKFLKGYPPTSTSDEIIPSWPLVRE